MGREGHPAQKEWPQQNLGGDTRGGGGNSKAPRLAGGWMDGCLRYGGDSGSQLGRWRKALKTMLRVVFILQARESH